MYNKICEHCKKEYKTKKKNQRFCCLICRSQKIMPTYKENYKPWNYDDNKIRNCLVCGCKLHQQTKGGKCKIHQDKIKRNLIGKTGGYRKGSGRGKCGWYNDFWCDSSWELAWVIYHLDHNIIFKRNTKFFEYSFGGKIRKYYPDFIKDGIYYEIKGFKTVQSEEKRKQFPTNEELVMIYENDMHNMLEYVKNEYGLNFIELYKEQEYKKKEYKQRKKRIIITPKYCEKCGNKLDNRTIGIFCKNCKGIKQRKVERPTYNDLMLEIKNSNYVQVAKKYDVCDNTIRKWIKNSECSSNGGAPD